MYVQTSAVLHVWCGDGGVACCSSLHTAGCFERKTVVSVAKEKWEKDTYDVGRHVAVREWHTSVSGVSKVRKFSFRKNKVNTNL